MIVGLLIVIVGLVESDCKVFECCGRVFKNDLGLIECDCKVILI